MRKLIITVVFAAGFLALVGATAIALLALPQEELMYAMNPHDLPAHAQSVPLWIPA
jgi:hypothetical protein